MSLLNMFVPWAFLHRPYSLSKSCDTRQGQAPQLSPLHTLVTFIPFIPLEWNLGERSVS